MNLAAERNTDEARPGCRRVAALAPVAAALGSAASWGMGDFLGGLAVKRGPVVRILLAGQALSLVLLVALAALVESRLPTASEAAWGAAAGVSGAVGLGALYASLGRGRMGVAAPVSGVLAAGIPVVVGVFVEGPPGVLALSGFALAFAGIALVAGPKAERPDPTTLGLAVLAGVGFGGLLTLLGRAGGPFFGVIVAARVGSLAAVLVAFALARPRGPTPWVLALSAGALDVTGNAAYALAARLGRLDVAAVLSSLYPIATVVLARVVLGERMTRPQAAGVALMLAAIPLVAVG